MLRIYLKYCIRVVGCKISHLMQRRVDAFEIYLIDWIVNIAPF